MTLWRVRSRRAADSRPGRPTALTSRVSAVICCAVADGLTLVDAAKLAGVSYATVKRWRRDGAKKHARDEFRTFRTDIDRSRLQAKSAMCVLIQKHAKDSWNAAAWWLERHYPREYGPKHLVAAQVEEVVTSILATVKAHADETTYRRVLDALAGVPSGPPVLR